jgi:hypothetical protein
MQIALFDMSHDYSLDVIKSNYDDIMWYLVLKYSFEFVDIRRNAFKFMTTDYRRIENWILVVDYFKGLFIVWIQN